jgi:glycosyltransferase involved in cell wall biosynthesis
MKIAIDCRLLDTRNNAGISRYTEYILDYYMSRFDKDDIIIISNKITDIPGIQHVLTNLKPFSIIDFYLFRGFVKGLNADILHCPFFSSIHKPINGLSVILTVHDLMYRLLPDFFSKYYFLNFLGRIYYNIIVGRSIASSAEIIAVSETTHDAIKSIYTTNSSIVPEHSSISLPSDVDILKKNNIAHKGYFFYCGNSRRHKNIDFIKSVFSKNPALPRLVIAGAKHKSEHYNIQCIGVVTDSELRALYEGAIAFVFASKYEGFGLPVLEALSAGTQVVASRISAFLEFKSPGIHYFDLDDEADFIAALNSASINPKLTPVEFYTPYEQNNIYAKMDLILERLTGDRKS